MHVCVSGVFYGYDGRTDTGPPADNTCVTVLNDIVKGCPNVRFHLASLVEESFLDGI
jgi:hypothetical protein